MSRAASLDHVTLQSPLPVKLQAFSDINKRNTVRNRLYEYYRYNMIHRLADRKSLSEFLGHRHHFAPYQFLRHFEVASNIRFLADRFRWANTNMLVELTQ
jgi:hypothetical protein